MRLSLCLLPKTTIRVQKRDSALKYVKALKFIKFDEARGVPDHTTFVGISRGLKFRFAPSVFLATYYTNKTSKPTTKAHATK